jgi:hypothetical protein
LFGVGKDTSVPSSYKIGMKLRRQKHCVFMEQEWNQPLQMPVNQFFFTFKGKESWISLDLKNTLHSENESTTAITYSSHNVKYKNPIQPAIGQTSLYR